MALTDLLKWMQSSLNHNGDLCDTLRVEVAEPICRGASNLLEHDGVFHLYTATNHYSITAKARYVLEVEPAKLSLSPHVRPILCDDGEASMYQCRKCGAVVTNTERLDGHADSPCEDNGDLSSFGLTEHGPSRFSNVSWLFGSLHCSVEARAPRAGEDWKRSRVLADNVRFSMAHWNEIVGRMLSCEIVRVHRDALGGRTSFALPPVGLPQR